MTMKFFSGQRVPLQAEQFIDAATARLYDEHAHRFMGLVFRRFVDTLNDISLPGSRVLDIGTGSGCLAIELAKAHPDWQITGIDISEKMLELARANAARAGLADKIEFLEYSAEALPFPKDSFDLVVSNASLHLWQEPRQVFKEIVRVTAPGGYCLLWDNLRLGGLAPFFKLVGWWLGMNQTQRQLWLQAIRSSYTVGEARDMLKDSPLKTASVNLIPDLLELSIAWQK